MPRIRFTLIKSSVDQDNEAKLEHLLTNNSELVPRIGEYVSIEINGIATAYIVASVGYGFSSKETGWTIEVFLSNPIPETAMFAKIAELASK